MICYCAELGDMYNGDITDDAVAQQISFMNTAYSPAQVSQYGNRA